MAASGVPAPGHKPLEDDQLLRRGRLCVAGYGGDEIQLLNRVHFEKRIKGLCGAKPPQKPGWTNAVVLGGWLNGPEPWEPGAGERYH
jgi:hypothetical protein